MPLILGRTKNQDYSLRERYESLASRGPSSRPTARHGMGKPCSALSCLSDCRDPEQPAYAGQRMADRNSYRAGNMDNGAGLIRAEWQQNKEDIERNSRSYATGRLRARGRRPRSHTLLAPVVGLAERPALAHLTGWLSPPPSPPPRPNPWRPSRK
jgi:hypothetical protein